MLLVHILRDGVILVPPFPAPKISKLLHARSIHPTDHFWHEGMPDWQLVGTRWEPDDGSSAAPSIRPEVISSTPAAAPAIAHETTPLVPSRRNRPSLLHACKKRYYETFAPWAKDAAAPQTS
jgi:hypothetical protein